MILVTPRDLETITAVRAGLADGSARRARMDARLRIGEVAAVLRVTSAAVSQWEAGARTPTARHALAYARLLARLAEAA
jgi:DNA-binding transcriptional regulator YiaG